MLTDLVAGWPDLLKGNGYRRTSLPTNKYNCVAHVFGDDTRWWEPDGFGICHWPDDVTRTYALSSYIKLCKKYGYQMCADGAHEEEYEKVAIYCEGDKFRHIARQMADGRWTSKLGELDDITHDLDALIGDAYGTPAKFLKRRISTSGPVQIVRS